MADCTSTSSSSPSRKRPRLNDDDSSSLPTAAEERRCFRRWLEASQLAAAAAVHQAQHKDTEEEEPAAQRKARRAAHDAYLEALAALKLEERGLAYDPMRRAFVDHFPNVDGRPSSRLHFQYYPVAAASQAQQQQLPQQSPPQHQYELRVVNPDTKRRAPPCTIGTLERYLPRRYRGISPQRVGVLLLEGAAAPPSAPGGVEFRVYDLTAAPFATAAPGNGEAFNREFLRAVEGDGCDVVLLVKREAAGTIDLFYPTYPALLAGGLLLLTPLHVYQVDGCEAGAQDVVQCLLDRASGVLGAVIVDREELPHLPSVRYDRQRHGREPGLASARAAAAAAAAAAGASLGIEADGRALRVTGKLGVGRYVPRFPHGWFSEDTAILLATALRVFRPKAVLELGAWLGLSSRFILREGKGSVRRFVSVDRFKNTAVGNAARLSDVSPLDKLYFYHLRFESFYANMEGRDGFSDAWVGGEKGEEGKGGASVGEQEEEGGKQRDELRPGGGVGGVEEKEGGKPLPPPEVIMLRADIHEAPQLMHDAHEACDMVFVDAEKDAGRLARLLRTVQRLYPSAVIVGDDLGFAGVKQALVDVRVPTGRLVTREEAYLILPPAAAEEKEAVLSVMEEGVAPRLAVPEWQREVVSLIAQGSYEEAVALGQEHGLGLGDVLYSPGKSILHDVCRRRDSEALAFVGRFVEGLVERAEEEGEGGEGGRALVPVNDVGLTPLDYLCSDINF